MCIHRVELCSSKNIGVEDWDVSKHVKFNNTFFLQFFISYLVPTTHLNDLGTTVLSLTTS